MRITKVQLTQTPPPKAKSVKNSSNVFAKNNQSDAYTPSFKSGCPEEIQRLADNLINALLPPKDKKRMAASLKRLLDSRPVVTNVEGGNRAESNTACVEAVLDPNIAPMQRNDKIGKLMSRRFKQLMTEGGTGNTERDIAENSDKIREHDDRMYAAYARLIKTRPAKPL